MKKKRRAWKLREEEIKDSAEGVMREMKKKQELNKLVRELTAFKAQVEQRSSSKRELADKAVHVFVEVKDSATEPILKLVGRAKMEGLEEVMERKRRRRRRVRGRGRGKKKRGPRTALRQVRHHRQKKKVQEDVEMGDEVSFSPYEDLSEYEKERVEERGPGGLQSPKKQPTKRQVGIKAVKSSAAKYIKSTKPVDTEEYIDIKALLCAEYPANIGCEENRNGGIMGARSLLGVHRRMGKTASSVVIFLNSPVSFHVQGSQLGMSRWPPTEVYNLDRGRKRPEVRVVDSDSGSDSGW
ncbi:hypothetical protein BGX38DRAFT_1268558 [Terfezia claveryi]|nr:hypothetical protein BGX38DRAFT_1268558 [Terfezia claveryi]